MPLIQSIILRVSVPQLQNLNGPFKLLQGIQSIYQLDDDLEIALCFKAEGFGEFAAKTQDTGFGWAMGAVKFDGHGAALHCAIAQLEFLCQKVDLEVKQ